MCEPAEKAGSAAPSTSTSSKLLMSMASRVEFDPVPAMPRVDKARLKSHVDVSWDGDNGRAVVKGQGDVVPGLTALPGDEKLAGVPRTWKPKPRLAEDA